MKIFREENGKSHYKVYCEGDDEEDAIEIVSRMSLTELNDNEQTENVIPFGTYVLADGEDKLDTILYYDAQIIGMDQDGRYKIYYLGSGDIYYQERNKVVMGPMASSRASPTDENGFSSCDEFKQFLFDQILPSTATITHKIGDNGCLVLVSSSRTKEGGDAASIIATYDGRNHFEMNFFSPNKRRSILDLAKELSKPMDLPGFVRTHIDFHPRGYGRVITFSEDLDKPYFGTKKVPIL